MELEEALDEILFVLRRGNSNVETELRNKLSAELNNSFDVRKLCVQLYQEGYVDYLPNGFIAITSKGDNYSYIKKTEEEIITEQKTVNQLKRTNNIVPLLILILILQLLILFKLFFFCNI